MDLVYAVPVAAATALATPIVLLAALRVQGMIARWARRCAPPFFLMLAACDIGDDSLATIIGCGDLPCPDAGTGGTGGMGGAPTDAGGDAPIATTCDLQDVTCPILPHAVVCRFYTGGPCQFAACVPSYENCNGAAGDGCEVNVTNDPGNCGNCGSVCASGGLCVGGVCK